MIAYRKKLKKKNELLFKSEHEIESEDDISTSKMIHFVKGMMRKSKTFDKRA